jgi:BrnA antitoxin of type II toxin-antitoxin system
MAHSLLSILMVVLSAAGSKAEIVQPVGKQPISIRLDQDVLDFFKTGGAGYQRRINAVLRAYMGEAIKGNVSKPGKRSAIPGRVQR